MYNTVVNAAPGDATATGTCHSNAVSWSAVVAGALAATAVSLGLLMFGSGIGLAIASPWMASGTVGGAVASFTAKTAIWLIVMQWVASAFGGFLAGRLRHRWHSLHGDEVFFRDTAHGFLTWALATIVTATVLASAGASILGGGVHTAAMMAGNSHADRPGAGPEMAGMSDPLAYTVDGLFRTTKPGTPDDRDARMEAGRIFLVDLKNDNFPDADRAYLAQSVAARTGLSDADATARVNIAISEATADKEKAKAAADEARKSAATASIFAFLSMLVGAFIACVAAALGGKRRDQY